MTYNFQPNNISQKRLFGASFFCLNINMQSFRDFFLENRKGEKKSRTHTNVFKGTLTYDNGTQQKHKMTYKTNIADPDEQAHAIDNMLDGITTTKVVTPDLLSHITRTYNVDINAMNVGDKPKTLGNSKVEVYKIAGFQGGPVVMLRRKSS